jgi:hypothetical protein
MNTPKSLYPSLSLTHFLKNKNNREHIKPSCYVSGGPHLKVGWLCKLSRLISRNSAKQARRLRIRQTDRQTDRETGTRKERVVKSNRNNYFLFHASVSKQLQSPGFTTHLLTMPLEHPLEWQSSHLVII